MKTKVTLLLIILMAGQSAIAAPKPITEAERKKSRLQIDAAVLKAARKTVTSLDLQGKGITDLTSLAELTELKRLKLGWNPITDLTLLAGLTKLEFLDLRVNKSKDLPPLAGLKTLRIIYLDQNPQIKDYSSLTAIRAQLEEFSCSHNAITNLETVGVAQMRSLKKIWLDHNKINGLKPLAGLQRLEQLHLRYCQVSNLAALAGLTKLEKLDLHGNQVSNLAALAGLKGLNALWLSENKITDITDLKLWSGLTKLRSLHLSNNQITDLTPLMSLKQVGYIDLRGNPKLSYDDIGKLKKALPKCRIDHDALPSQLLAAQEKLREINKEPGLRIQWTESTRTLRVHSRGHEALKDILPLKGLQIEHLPLSRQHGISSLHPLAGMKLKSLWLAGSKVTDLTPLKGMPLEELGINFYGDLYFPSCNVSDLSPLRGMKLKKLRLEKTKVTSIAALEGMPLEELLLTDSPISDLTPLRNIKTLKILSISGTKVTSLEALSGLDLDRLYFSRTKVSDLKPLKNMGLMHVDGDQTLVSSIAHLKGDQLYSINLQRSNLSSIEPLRNMPNLNSLLFADSKVRDLSPLVSCPKITYLSITDPKQVSGLEAVRSLKSLFRISIKPMAGYVHNKMTPVDFWNLMADPDYKPNYSK